MSAAAAPPHSDSQAIEDLLRQAIAHHQAGRLLEAGQLYQTILRTHPGHPEANHKLGVIAVQAQQPQAGLAYLAAALEAGPTCGAYWIDYIDALYRAGHQQDACAVLALARQQGLEGEAIETLTARIATAPLPAVVSDGGHTPTTVQDAPTPASFRQEAQALLAVFNAGQLTEAATLAGQLTERYPHQAFGWKTLGVVLKLLGRDADALAPMRHAVSLDSADTESRYNLSVVLQALGHLDEAEAGYRQVLENDPRYAGAALNLGVLLNATGRLEEAEVVLRQALELRPQASEAHANLGVVLNALDRPDEAEASLLTAIELQPDNAVAHNSLGVALQAQERAEDAEASYRRALECASEYGAAHRNLGMLLADQERFDEADAHFLRALEIDSRDVEALGNRSNLLSRMERLAEAEAGFRAALAINPANARMHANLGRLLRNAQRLEEATTHFREALQLDPEDRNVRNLLGNTLLERGYAAEAEGCFRGILKSMPDNAAALNNLGNALMGLGRLDEATVALRRAAEQAPDSAPLRSNLLFALSLSSQVDPGSLFAEHVDFGEHFERDLKPAWPEHRHVRDAERRLHVGFVSADFFNHAVASFVEPVLQCLAGQPGLTLHAYYNHVINDAVTAKLRACFDHWNAVSDLTDEALADKIRTDGIDILIDLSGHTGFNRMLTFARKPAPLQATWIGYPSTTGLSAMDYYLTDRHTLPPGRFDDQFTEKIAYLPANSPFLGAPEAPAINSLPALGRGHITFGSFSRPNKISREVVTVWSTLMRAVPDSRMILGGMPENGGHAVLATWFAEEGIDPARLDFRTRSSLTEYLGLHHEVDLCLDTFPYNSGTTTLHALWMGVPTLTLAGNTVAGRSGASILGHAGLDVFVAEDIEDFVAKGESWCGRLDELSAIRAGLRERFAASPRGQPAVVAAGVARALRMMWQRWCAGLPPASFEVPVDDTMKQERSA
ncbi:MAG: tetratricopeptide repeat protein [Pseudomonadota bacterium]